MSTRARTLALISCPFIGYAIGALAALVLHHTNARRSA